MTVEVGVRGTEQRDNSEELVQKTSFSRCVLRSEEVRTTARRSAHRHAARKPWPSSWCRAALRVGRCGGSRRRRGGGRGARRGNGRLGRGGGARGRGGGGQGHAPGITAPPSQKITHLGSARRSSSIPEAVTFVPFRYRIRRQLICLRCLTAASSIGVLSGSVAAGWGAA